MHTRQSKRRRLIIRTVVSTIMTVAVLLISTILLFLMLGYRFNKDEGTITQGGLVQFITTPPGAHVTVGSAKLANITPSKITLAPGTYPITIERDKYHTWQKTVDISAGTVTWLNSARLVPKNLQMTKVIEHPTVSSLQFSPKARFAAIVQDAAKPIITIDTIDRVAAVKSINLELPQGSYTTGTAHAFSIEQWGGAERYILVKHVFDGKTEWVVADTQDIARSRLIGAINDVQPTNAVFDPRANTSVIALYADGTMRHIQTISGEATQYPLANIASFSFISDQSFAYTTIPTNGTVSTGYYTLDATTARAIKTYQTTGPVHIAGGRYFATQYFLTSVDKELAIHSIETLPRSDSSDPWSLKLVEKRLVNEPISSVASHANGRLAVITHDTSQSIYDIERKQFVTTKISRLNSPITEQLEWFDDFNFWSTASGTLRMYEYDGTNQHDIGPVAEGSHATFSDNNKYLYTLVKSPTGMQIQAITMILE